MSDQLNLARLVGNFIDTSRPDAIEVKGQRSDAMAPLDGVVTQRPS